MNKTKYKFLLLIPAAMFLASCNDDFLERYPQGKVTEATAFTSYETAYSYCLSLYGVLNDQTYFGGPVPQSNAMGTSVLDTYSGLLTNYGYGAGTVPNPYGEGTVTIPASTTGEYYNPYYYIRMANILLSHISEPEATEEQRLHLEAVARFFRAYCHFGLLMNYGDVIYVNELITDDSEKLTAPRDSRLYVADQIYKELEWCAENIQDQVAEPNTVNSDVVNALFSRFTLFEGTWRKYHNVNESDCAANGYVTGEQLLEKCAEVSKALMEKHPALYTGTAEGNYDGQGWGQLWTTENLQGVPGVLLYMKYTEDYKMHRLGHFEHIGSAALEMPQSTVDLYLTKDGLPIHNANVKYYDYTGNGYVEGEPYDYSNCDVYKTFRNRDPRMLQTIMPPYHVYASGGTGANDFYYDMSNGGRFMEYLQMFPNRGTDTGLTVTDAEGREQRVYRLPQVHTGYYLINWHKALPSGNWGGNIQKNVPNSALGTPDESIIENGNIMYSSGTGYQKGKSGYFVWKHHACWDRQDQNYAREISDKPLFKIEEVMLNYAEVMWELGRFNQGVADETINKLRDRAEVGRMDVGSINDSFDPDRDPSVDPVLWEIRRERLIELMGESFSWMDVRRWKKADWFVNKQHYGVYVENVSESGIASQTYGETGILKRGGTTEATAADLQAQGNAGHLFYYLSPTSAGTGWQDKYYLYPIPTSELLLNPNLKQQEGW